LSFKIPTNKKEKNACENKNATFFFIKRERLRREKTTEMIQRREER
jgi:hypothetical protein